MRWTVLLAIPVLWECAEPPRAPGFFENRTVDWRFQKRGELEAPIKIVYVDIDSRSISDFGNWPWTRHPMRYRRGCARHDGGAKAVGFDIGLPPRASRRIGRGCGPAIWSWRDLCSKDPPAAPPPVVFAASFFGGLIGRHGSL